MAMKSKPQKIKKSKLDVYLNAADRMPKSEQTQKILDKHAKRLAQQAHKKSSTGNLTTYIRFRLGTKDYYGIPYQFAKEVMPKPKITQVPCVPDFVTGVINWRGVLLSVLDLKKFFRLQSTSSSDNTNAYIIVIAEKGIMLGILTDNIEGSDMFDSENIDAPFSSQKFVKPEYILGLHKGSTAIINIKSIIASFVQQLSKTMDRS